ncbi:MAG TPA: hypothetical protein VIN59_06635 [Alphaproteobacteria bacterium]
MATKSAAAKPAFVLSLSDRANEAAIPPAANDQYDEHRFEKAFLSLMIAFAGEKVVKQSLRL